MRSPTAASLPMEAGGDDHDPITTGSEAREIYPPGKTELPHSLDVKGKPLQGKPAGAGQNLRPRPSATWTAGCSSDSNEGLVDNLCAAGLITTSRVREVFLATDRALYVPCQEGSPTEASSSSPHRRRRSKTYKYGPYADAPQSIGSKVTISAPFIHAACLELLADRIEAEGSRVLDVGCGSGILLAYIARMARPSATVVGVEVVQRLVDTSRSNLERDGFCLREPRPVGCCRIEVLQGDGWDGVAELGPFDAINVGAGAPRIPEELVRQLKPGGALVVPVGKEQANQVLTLVVKHPGAGLEETKVAFPPVRFVPLVGGGPAAQPPGPRPCLGPGKPETSVDTAGGGVDWNARYRKGWAYGKEPSRFLAEAAELHLRPLLQRARAGSRGSEGEAPGLRILSLGEGQGRNAVHLASSLPGLHCVGVDSSSVGLSKARRLAKQRGVAASLTTVVADLTTYEPDTGAFDAVISIFCVLPPRQRKALHQRCAQALRPGGVVVVECFSLGQQELWVQGRPWQLGPPADQMVSWEQLAGDFEGLSVEVGEEVSEELAEGPFHRGPARLTRFVAFKPENDIMDSKLPVSLSADARSHGQEGVSPSSVNMEASPLCDLGVVRALECSGSFICSAVQEVFNEAAVGGPAALPPRPSSGPRDWLLSYAGWSVRAACREAERAGWCRGCWVPSHLCLCRSITSAIWESVSRLPSPSSRHGICRAARRGVSLRWVILLHPGEFLRSTSTARIAAPCLAALGFNAELLVLGSKAHEHRLGKVLKAAAAGTPTFMMFPGLDEKRFGIGEQLDDAIKIIPAAGGCHEISAPPAVTSVPEMLRHAGLAGMDPLGGKEAGDVVVTVLVPDGTWQGARAIAVDVLRRHSLLAESISPPLEQRIPCVALDAAAVSNHRSPLIEALKSGQGMGRITTLEACGLMLREAGDPQAAEGLLGALQPLVDYVRAMLAPQPSPLPRLSGEPHPRPSFPEKSVLPILADPGAREMSKWSSALQRVARAVPEAHAGVHHALRFCVVCGDNLATPDRMQPHLRGRRHCEAVARRHLSIQRCAKSDPPKEPEVCGDGSITDERALEVLAKYSAGPLLEWPPEPPDVALVALRNTARRACQPAEPGRPRTSQANGQPSP